MKTNRVTQIFLFLLICVLLQSCGCYGPTLVYSWRPKPWTHPYKANVETGLDSLININGYYMTEDSTKLYSIMFYNNGLCVSLNNRVGFNENGNAVSPLNKIYSENKENINNNIDLFYKNATSWGTYELLNDTINAFVIQNLSGCDGTRKNIISMKYLIKENKQLKLLFISNSNKDYGYSKELNVPDCTFYPLKHKLNSSECPYLNKKWFYKSDKK